MTTDPNTLREEVYGVMHDLQCDEKPQPHSWKEHLPWDDDYYETDAEALADGIIRVVAADIGSNFLDAPASVIRCTTHHACPCAQYRLDRLDDLSTPEQRTLATDWDGA